MKMFLRGTMIVAGVALSIGALTGCFFSADAMLETWRDDFFMHHLYWNPVTSTYLGGSGYDAALADTDTRLRDYSPEALARELAYYQCVQERISVIPFDRLTPANQLDYTVLKGELAFMVHTISETRIHEYAIETYVVEAVNGINYQLQQLQSLGDSLFGTEAEWAAIIARAAAVPAYVETALENLERGVASGNLPDWRLVERDGLDGGANAAAFFRTDLLEIAAGDLGDQTYAASTLEALEPVCAAAADAYDAFVAALPALYPDKDAVDRYAIGEAEYTWRIQNNFGIETPLDELYEYGAQQVAEIEAALFDTAQAIAAEEGLEIPFDTDAAKRESTRIVLAWLAQDAPEDDDALFQLYRDLTDAAVQYGRDQELFDVPEDYELDIVETPEVLRSSLWAAYNPAPPFKPGAIGAFYVTPTGDDPVQLAKFSPSEIAATAVHEGFCGHDWHYHFMSEHAAEISNIRWLPIGEVQGMSAMWSDSMGAEGWAHYSEQLMAEPVEGCPYGFYTMETYLSYLTQALMRAVRVRVDVGLHTGWMSYDEAVDYMAAHFGLYPDARDHADTDPEAEAAFLQADREIFRYSKWPTQAITYNIAKHAILELRDECEAAWGAAYTEREFHEHIMMQGTVSPGYYEEIVIETPPEQWAPLSD